MAVNPPSCYILCCFLNPWWSPGDEYEMVDDNTPSSPIKEIEEEEGSSITNLKEDEVNTTKLRYSLVSDSRKAYYKAFSYLGRDTYYDGVIKNELYKEVIARLEANIKITIEEDFLLLRRVISRCQSEAIQAWMIDEYEIYRDSYLRLFGIGGDIVDARVSLINAQNVKFTPKDRILYYQKAIYYTHELKEKNVIRAQYELYYDRNYCCC